MKRTILNRLWVIAAYIFAGILCGKLGWFANDIKYWLVLGILISMDLAYLFK